MITYNGFKPNEERVYNQKPRKADNGHTVVKVITKRRGHDFAFTYTWVCECGYTLRSIRTVESLVHRHESHRREKAAR
jgi:hypothetical protein